MFAHAIWADLCFANRRSAFRKGSGYLTHDLSVRSNVEGSLLLRSTRFQIHGEEHIEVLVDTIPDQHSFEVRIFLATRPDEIARIPYIRMAGPRVNRCTAKEGPPSGAVTSQVPINASYCA